MVYYDLVFEPLMEHLHKTGSQLHTNFLLTGALALATKLDRPIYSSSALTIESKDGSFFRLRIESPYRHRRTLGEGLRTPPLLSGRDKLLREERKCEN